MFIMDTIRRRLWSVDAEWFHDCAQVDSIRMCALYDTIVRMIWAMDFDWRQLPQHSDPDYTRRPLPPGQQCAELVPKAPRLVRSSEEEASFSLIESDSSDPTPIQTQEDRQRQQDLDLLDQVDHDELWHSQWEDIY